MPNTVYSITADGGADGVLGGVTAAGADDTAAFNRTATMARGNRWYTGSDVPLRFSLQGWTLQSGNVYKTPLPVPQNKLGNDLAGVDAAWALLDYLTVNGTEYLKASPATTTPAASRWSIVGNTLYVNVGGGSPAGMTVIVLAKQGVMSIPAGGYRFINLDIPEGIRVQIDAGATIASSGTAVGPRGNYLWGIGANVNNAAVHNVAVVPVGSTATNKRTNVPAEQGGATVASFSGVFQTWDFNARYVVNLDVEDVGGNHDNSWLTMQNSRWCNVTGYLIYQNQRVSPAKGNYGNANSTSAILPKHQKNPSGTSDLVNWLPVACNYDNGVMIGAPAGYGTFQITSCLQTTFTNQFSVGGTLGRIETDATPGAVHSTTLDNLEVHYGNRCASFTAHSQLNGTVTARNLKTRECYEGVVFNYGANQFTINIGCTDFRGGRTGSPGGTDGLAQAIDNTITNGAWVRTGSYKPIAFGGGGGGGSQPPNLTFGANVGCSGTWIKASDRACLSVTPCGGNPPPGAPTLTLHHTPTTNPDGSVSGTCGQAGAWSWQLDGGGFTAGAANSTTDAYPFAGLATGSHTIQAKVTNANGTSPTTSVVFTVDAGGVPLKGVISAGPAALTDDSSATFSFSASGSVSLQTSLDGAAFGTMTSPHTFTGLLPGSHTLVVHGTNGSGIGTNSDAYSWTVVDQGPLPAVSLGATPITDGDAMWVETATVDLNLQLGDDVQDGDMLVMLVGWHSNGTITPPAGWTHAPGSPQVSGTAIGTVVLTRVADGSETPTQHVVGPDSHGGIGTILNLGRVFALGGTAQAANSAGAAGTAVSVPGLTTSDDQAVELLFVFADAAIAASASAAWSQKFQQQQRQGAIADRQTMFGAYRLQALAGATGAAGATIGSARWTAHHLAFIPEQLHLAVTTPEGSISITGKAGDSYSVTGNATSPRGVQSLTVNGQVLTLAPSGDFDTAIILAVGENPVVVIATEATTGRQITVSMTITLSDQVTPTTIEISTDVGRVDLLIQQRGIDPRPVP